MSGAKSMIEQVANGVDVTQVVEAAWKKGTSGEATALVEFKIEWGDENKYDPKKLFEDNFKEMVERGFILHDDADLTDVKFKSWKAKVYK
jgi:hypothetical protein